MSIYAVNGKEPIAAWIPSLDTAGNGTTTLTDLVGSNNGTLTNMDEATDWVADTDAGGVRALDFDGVDDRVQLSSTLSLSLPFSIGLWVKSSSTVNSTVLGNNGTTGSAFIGSFTNRVRARVTGGIQVIGPLQSEWHHILAVYDTANLVTLYADGALFGTPATNSIPPFLSMQVIGCSPALNQFYAALLDDIRIWNAALNAADVSALYAAGLGRGITFGGTTIQTRRRRDLGGFGL